MAEYKPLVRNTIKITTETTLYHNTDLDIGEVLVMPRVKHISADKSAVEYCGLMPTGMMVFTGTTGMTYYKYYTEATESKCAPHMADVKAVSDKVLTSLGATRVSVDGGTYYGYKSAVYCVPSLYTSAYGSSTKSSATVPQNGMLPASKMKAVVYVSATQTISTHEIDNPIVMLDETAYKAINYYPYIYVIPRFGVNKGANDVVLALEIEYPKHNVTLNTSVSGLQYSLDDGLTFTDVTDGTTLEQIEHVVFKNTSDLVINVGTKNGGLDVASISAGATYVAVPEADGTWYIS